MRTTTWLGMGALTLVLLVGCSKPQDLLIGKWDSSDGKGLTIEFTKDGVYRWSVIKGIPLSLNGKYEFAADDQVHLEKSFGKLTWKETYKVSVKKEELVATDEKGTKFEFKRVK
jgi:uncharacterized protein (TIGR03066 family)